MAQEEIKLSDINKTDALCGIRFLIKKGHLRKLTAQLVEVYCPRFEWWVHRKKLFGEEVKVVLFRLRVVIFSDVWKYYIFSCQHLANIIIIYFSVKIKAIFEQIVVYLFSNCKLWSNFVQKCQNFTQCAICGNGSDIVSFSLWRYVELYGIFTIFAGNTNENSSNGLAC